VKLSVADLDLSLRHTFRISRGATDVARNVLVRLEHEGLTGLGEAHPPGFFGENREKAKAMLATLGGELKGDPTDIDAVLDGLPPEIAASHGPRAALDIALHDLWGQLHGEPLWRLWGLDRAATPVTSFTIGIASIEAMQARVREAERYPLLKIKLGTDRGLEILEGIRAVTDKPLRVDANAAWTVEEAIEKIHAIEPYGIELVEQPIPPGDVEGLRRIREAISVPLLVDESVTDAASIPPLAGAVDGINIKLMKCGGLREARRMIELARSLGLQVMLGCYIESSVSITAAAHLSPLADYADLDGCLLIDDDPYTGVTLDADARLLLPGGPGLGVLRRTRAPTTQGRGASGDP